MTDEEVASQPGGVATRTEGQGDAPVVEPVFTPKDFRLNLGARLGVVEEAPPPGTVEPLSDLDNPAIRKLTWEHVVADRTESSTPPSKSPPHTSATTVPLPPPSRVAPPAPPKPPFEPPATHSSAKPTKSRATRTKPVVEVSTVVEEEIEADPEIDADNLLEPDVVVDEDESIHQLEVEDDDEDPEPAVEVVAEVTVVARPAEEAKPEINRLAFVPDQIDDDSPIELPPITPSGPVVAHPQSVYAPVLAETLYVPQPQQVPKKVVPIATADPKMQRRQPSRKPKRHLLRSFMTLVVLFGLLAGGAFAAKKYLLHQPKWSVELKPLADGVARTRDLQYKEAVEITELPVADYARRLAATPAVTTADKAPAWRALGLLTGELDLEAVGRQALNDSPAFYDPATKTIVVSSDLAPYEHLYRFAIRRALTMALLDQQYDWSTRVAAASPAVALGIRATIDGDALRVANTLAADDAPDQLAPELFTFVQGHGNTVSPSQFAATLAGRAGVAMRPTISSMANDPVALAALELSTPGSDAVLDVTGGSSTVVSPTGAQGMTFWYYVLASRIDDTQAWSAALRWSGDTLATSTGSTSQCVDATVAAPDADGAALMLGAFQAWAAAAPVESTTTVTPVDGNQVAIRACDPGAAVSAQIPARIPVAFGGAAVERALVEA
ncbi:MAG: hypothetical protein ABI949_08315, partial [Ilumatobacteraceae bacterium]